MDSLYHMGDSNSWNQMVEDQWQLINHIAAEHELPLIIMGHSMGSFMATRFCQQQGHRLQQQLNSRLIGLVLSGSNYDAPAAFKLAAAVAWVERLRCGKRNSSNLLEQLSFGSFNRSFAPTRTEKDWLSSDQKVVDAYIAENALVIPLLQYVQPILSAPGVIVTPHASGALLPHLMKRA